MQMFHFDDPSLHVTPPRVCYVKSTRPDFVLSNVINDSCMELRRQPSPVSRPVLFAKYLSSTSPQAEKVTCMRELASSVYNTNTNTNVEFLFGCQLYQTETGPEVNKSMSE
jgi:hypothetical protein